jgi:hypothetical protein
MHSLSLEKNRVLGGYSAAYEASTSISDEALSDLVDGCLRMLVPSVTSDHKSREFIDYKGRNPNDQLLAGLPGAKKDEVFRLGGSCAVEQKGDSFEWEPFEVCCYSSFSRFEGVHHIVHALETHRAGSIPAWIPERFLGFAAPIRPRYFRVGLEHFCSRRTFFSLGFNPEVNESLILDSSEGSLHVRVSVESPSRRPEKLFAKAPALKLAAQIIRQTCLIDLAGEYDKLLTERW